MAEFHTLRDANRARQAEWDKDSRISLAYRGNELAGEVGEACNLIKKIERERLGIAGSRATHEQLAEELADVVICTDLIAMDEGIDLDAAVAAKFNATSVKVGLATRLAVAAATRGEQSAAVTSVIAERRRQIEGEGFYVEHDDQHRGGEIAAAAASYAVKTVDGHGDLRYPPFAWPWDPEWWKPKSRRDALVKAGALIIAEIERLDRLAAKRGDQ